MPTLAELNKGVTDKKTDGGKLSLAELNSKSTNPSVVGSQQIDPTAGAPAPINVADVLTAPKQPELQPSPLTVQNQSAVQQPVQITQPVNDQEQIAQQPNLSGEYKVAGTDITVGGAGESVPVQQTFKQHLKNTADDNLSQLTSTASILDKLVTPYFEPAVNSIQQAEKIPMIGSGITSDVKKKALDASIPLSTSLVYDGLNYLKATGDDSYSRLYNKFLSKSGTPESLTNSERLQLEQLGYKNTSVVLGNKFNDLNKLVTPKLQHLDNLLGRVEDAGNSIPKEASSLVDKYSSLVDEVNLLSGKLDPKSVDQTNQSSVDAYNKLYYQYKQKYDEANAMKPNVDKIFDEYKLYGSLYEDYNSEKNKVNQDPDVVAFRKTYNDIKTIDNYGNLMMSRYPDVESSYYKQQQVNKEFTGFDMGANKDETGAQKAGRQAENFSKYLWYTGEKLLNVVADIGGGVAKTIGSDELIKSRFEIPDLINSSYTKDEKGEHVNPYAVVPNIIAMIPTLAAYYVGGEVLAPLAGAGELAYANTLRTIGTVGTQFALGYGEDYENAVNNYGLTKDQAQAYSFLTNTFKGFIFAKLIPAVHSVGSALTPAITDAALKDGAESISKSLIDGIEKKTALNIGFNTYKKAVVNQLISATGMSSLEIADKLAQKISDEGTGKNNFNPKLNLDELGTHWIGNALTFLPMGALDVNNEVKRSNDVNNYIRLSSAVNADFLKDEFISKLNSGEITQEQHDNAVKIIDESVLAYNNIPKDLDAPTKSELIPLLTRRIQLEGEPMKTAAIKKELNDIENNISEVLNNKEKSDATNGKTTGKDSFIVTKDDMTQLDKEGEFAGDSRKTILGQVKGIVKAIGDRAHVILHKTEDSYLDAVKKAGADVLKFTGTEAVFDPDGNNGKGSIHFNLSKMKGDTVFHEGAHQVLAPFLKANPDFAKQKYDDLKTVFNNIVDAGGEDAVHAKKMLDELNSFAGEYITDGKEDYKGATTEEPLVEFINRLATGRYNDIFEKPESKGIVTAIRDWVNGLLKILGEKLTGQKESKGEDGVQLNSADDVISFARKMADAFKQGKEVKSNIDVKSDDFKSINDTNEHGDVIGTGIVPSDLKPLKESSDASVKDELTKLERGGILDDLKFGNISDISGEYLTTTMSDRSSSGELIYNNGIPYTKMGGLFYPLVMKKLGFNRVWAAMAKNKMDSLLRSLKPDENGMANIGIMTMGEQSHMSNIDSFDFVFNAIKNGFENKSGITKQKLIDAVNQAYNKKYSTGVSISESTGKPKINTRMSVDDIKNAVLENISHSDAAFDIRRNFLESLLGNAEKKDGRLTGIPNYNKMASLLEEPLTRDAKNGDVVAYMKVRVPDLSVIKTSNKESGHHKSFPFAIESKSPVDFVMLNNPVHVSDIYPEFINKSGNKVSYKDAEAKYGEDKAIRTHTRNIMLSSPSEKVPELKAKKQEYEDIIDGFYSPILRDVSATKFDKLPVKQWIEKFGKGEEAKWTGLTDWLNSQTGSVSKADIQKYLKDNRIQVVEVVKGIGALTDAEQTRLSELEDTSPAYLKDGEYEEMTTLRGKAGRTKYSQYQVEGEKSNYKEVLVTMPRKVGKGTVEQNEDGTFSIRKTDGTLTSKKWSSFEEADKYNESATKSVATDFKSSHFDEPNILVHLRMNTRTDAEGKKVLFLEEVQSDWGQQGKKEGFSNEKQLNTLKEERKKILDKTWNEGLESITPEEQAKFESLEREINKLLRANVSPAPFVTDTNSWTKLGLKVALKEAVKQGADKIAWTTGEQQNDRYDLSKQVEYIQYEDAFGGTKYVDISTQNSIITLQVDKEGKVLENKNTQLPDVVGKNLSDVIGKDATEKIMRGDGTKERIEPLVVKDDITGKYDVIINGRSVSSGHETYNDARTDYLKNPKYQSTRRLEGEGLKVGGKGMKGFYGSPTEGSLGIVGNVAKSLFKQEVKTVELDNSGNVNSTRVNTTEDIKVYSKQGYSFFENQKPISKQRAYEIIEGGDWLTAKKPIQNTQHSIDITPELKANIKEEGIALKPKKQNLLEGTDYEPDLTKDNNDYVFFHRTSAPKESILNGIDSRGYFSARTSKMEKGSQYGVASYYTKPIDSERAVTGSDYEVRVQKDKVYPMDSDPNNYKEKAKDIVLNRDAITINGEKVVPFEGRKISVEMANLAQRDGYEMAVTKWGNEGFPKLRADALVVLKPTSKNDASTLKSRKQDLVADTEKKKFMTEDDKGNYVFFHYSKQDLTKSGINPNKFGSNALTSREEKQKSVPVSMYYTEPNIQETGTGNYKHVVRIPKKEVYPFNEDPLGLLPVAREEFAKKFPERAFDFNNQIAWVSKLAAEKGYKMTVGDWGTNSKGKVNSLRAETPVKLTPELAHKPIGLNSIHINDKVEDFKSNRSLKAKKVDLPDTKVVDEKGEPLKMYHGGDTFRDDYGGATWFTSEKADAKQYAKTNHGVLTAAYLNLKNPLYAGDISHLHIKITPEIIASAKKRNIYNHIKIKNGEINFLERGDAMLIAQDTGYDGVIDINDKKILDAIVFNPKQIHFNNTLKARKEEQTELNTTVHQSPSDLKKHRFLDKGNQTREIFSVDDINSETAKYTWNDVNKPEQKYETTLNRVRKGGKYFWSEAGTKKVIPPSVEQSLPTQEVKDNGLSDNERKNLNIVPEDNLRARKESLGDPEFDILKDDYLGSIDRDHYQAGVQALKLQKEIQAATRAYRAEPEAEKEYDKDGNRIYHSKNNLKENFDRKWKTVDKAIQIYIDLKTHPEHHDMYYDKLTDGQKKIVDMSQNLTPEQQIVADKIAAEYESMKQGLTDAGILHSTQENYVSRAWDFENTAATDVNKKFVTSSRHTKQRTLGSILEGWAEGYKLKIEGATNNLATYKKEMANVLAARQLIDSGSKVKIGEEGDEHPLFSTYSRDGYKRIENRYFTKWNRVGKVDPITKEGDIAEDIRMQMNGGGKGVFVAEDGTVFQRLEVYAPDSIAKRLNNILGESALKGNGVADALTKAVGFVKNTMLFTSFFHHQAFIRNHLLSGIFNSAAELNPRVAYKKGLKLLESGNPQMVELIKAGLTIKPNLDYEENLNADKKKHIEKLDKHGFEIEQKNVLAKMYESQHRFLFEKFGAGLKAINSMNMYTNELRKHPEKDPNEIAKIVAAFQNENFGGLHLQRIERNPTKQHFMRLLMLAPDWTESNLQMARKAFKGGYEGKFYRAMWGKVFLRAAVASIATNLAMALMPDTNDPDKAGLIDRVASRYKRAWDEGHLNWTKLNISPLAHMFGANPDNDYYFSIFGHYTDPVRLGTAVAADASGSSDRSETIGFFFNKGSILTNTGLKVVTGKDWKGDDFTTFMEFMGLDDKGNYKENTHNKRTGVTHEAGSPKGGQLAGKLTKFSIGSTPFLKPNQFVTAAMEDSRSMLPLQIQGILQYAQGESDGVTLTSNMIGAGIIPASIKRKSGFDPLKLLGITKDEQLTTPTGNGETINGQSMSGQSLNGQPVVGEPLK